MRLLAVLVALGHGLSITAPVGWQMTHAHTGCTDPVERVTLVHGDQMLVLQERLRPAPAELRARRPLHARVRSAPTQMECCTVGDRKGWVVEFGDHGRAFYAYVYPGKEDPQPLLRILDSLRVR